MSHKAGGLKQWISAAQPRKRQKQTVFPPLRPYPQLLWRNQSWGCRRCIRQQCERARGRRRRWRVVSPSPPLWGLWSASMSSSAAPAPKKNSNRLAEMKNKCKFWQTNACLHEPHYHVDANAVWNKAHCFHPHQLSEQMADEALVAIHCVVALVWLCPHNVHQAVSSDCSLYV